MTLDALRCLCAVVEAGSFRAAAERVHRSQPAVSQQVKALETELGRTLIERRTCRPTPVGRRLYDRARHILNEVDSLARELADLDEAEVGELRVGTSDTTALYVLPPVVRAFSQALPRTQLVLVNRPTSAIAEQVLRGDLDLGIVTLPVGQPELEERALFEEKLLLVLRRKHPLAHRKSVALEALDGEPLLLLDALTRTGALLRAHFQRNRFDPVVALESGSFEVIKRYVAEGVGVSFLPENVVTPSDRHLATVEVPGLPRVAIGAVWRRGAYRTRAEQAFLELLAAPPA